MDTLTIDDVKRINARMGYHFFSPSAVRFFSSQVESGLLDNHCFVTSEQDTGRVSDTIKAWNGERRYSVRFFNEETGCIETIGKFGAYATLAEALRAARDYTGRF
jgi:hypothetical protein